MSTIAAATGKENNHWMKWVECQMKENFVEGISTLTYMDAAVRLMLKMWTILLLLLYSAYQEGE